MSPFLCRFKSVLLLPLNPLQCWYVQGIAGVPVFSGIGFRLVWWASATILTIMFLSWYAARIKARPELSPTFAIDQERRQELKSDEPALISRA